MKTLSSGHYTSHNQWFDNVIDENVILCYTSALEALGMYCGYVDESVIDVYAIEEGRYENIDYHIVPSFEGIEYQIVGKVRCTSFGKTINDMLGDIYIDRPALTEALANYYYSHNDSFDGIIISDENWSSFLEIKEDALDYYCE